MLIIQVHKINTYGTSEKSEKYLIIKDSFVIFLEYNFNYMDFPAAI